MIKTVIGIIKRYPSVEKIFRTFYHPWIPHEISKDRFLAFFNLHFKKVSFIQIGSNNGKSNDPIYEYVISGAWNGALVEPVGYLYEELKTTYKSVAHNLLFINAAISNEDGSATFYAIKQSDDKALPEWYNQLGSFNKDVILKHKNSIPNLEELIEEVQVPSLTFKTLRQMVPDKHVDLLHIDTEGFDYEILKLIDWNAFQPEVVIYEQRHLTQSDYKSSIKLMKCQNYEVFASDGDAVCIKPELFRLYMTTISLSAQPRES